MKIEKMIDQLQRIAKTNPGADVKLHHPTGCSALFCLCVADTSPNHAGVVFIEDETDIDIRNELYAQIEHAKEIGMNDNDLYTLLTDLGFTLKHFKEYLDIEDYNRFKKVVNIVYGQSKTIND